MNDDLLDKLFREKVLEQECLYPPRWPGSDVLWMSINERRRRKAKQRKLLWQFAAAVLITVLAGAFFIEYIFGWKGIGKVTVDALEKLDFPVVMGSVLITAGFFILINILADIIYGWIDPRVRLK